MQGYFVYALQHAGIEDQGRWGASTFPQKLQEEHRVGRFSPKWTKENFMASV